jgi:hypothetical protein
MDGRADARRVTRRSVLRAGGLAGGLVAGAPVLACVSGCVARTPAQEAGGQGPGPDMATASQAPLPVAEIEGIIRAKGTVSNGVLDIGIVRTDLPNVRKNGVPIKPAFEINGDFYFQALSDGMVIMNGDMALKPEELGPTIDAMVRHDLTFEAEHQHLTELQPMVWYIHMRGQGPARQVAEGCAAMLKATSTPLPQSPPKNPATPLDTKRLEKIIGSSASVGASGVVSFNFPQREPITLAGVRISPYLNVATPVDFQPLGGEEAVVVPDFGMLANQINNVARTMRGQGWAIDCLYNQETDENPQLFFSHQFKVGNAYQLAAEVRRGLEQTSVVIGLPARRSRPGHGDPGHPGLLDADPDPLAAAQQPVPAGIERRVIERELCPVIEQDRSRARSGRKRMHRSFHVAPPTSRRIGCDLPARGSVLLGPRPGRAAARPQPGERPGCRAHRLDQPAEAAEPGPVNQLGLLGCGDQPGPVGQRVGAGQPGGRALPPHAERPQGPPLRGEQRRARPGPLPGGGARVERDVGSDVAGAVGHRRNGPPASVSGQGAAGRARGTLVRVVGRHGQPAAQPADHLGPRLVPRPSHFRPLARTGQPPPAPEPGQVVRPGRAAEAFPARRRVHEHQPGPVAGELDGIDRHIVEPLIGHDQPGDGARQLMLPADPPGEPAGPAADLHPGQPQPPGEVSPGQRRGVRQQFPAAGSDVDQVQAGGPAQVGVDGLQQPQQRRRVARRRVHRRPEAGRRGRPTVEAVLGVQCLLRGIPPGEPRFPASLSRGRTGPAG